MRHVARSGRQDTLSKSLKPAQKDRALITRHGQPVGLPMGFKDEDDGCIDPLDNDPRFLEPVEEARRRLEEGKGLRLEDLARDVKPKGSSG